MKLPAVSRVTRNLAYMELPPSGGVVVPRRINSVKFPRKRRRECRFRLYRGCKSSPKSGGSTSWNGDDLDDRNSSNRVACVRWSNWRGVKVGVPRGPGIPLGSRKAAIDRTDTAFFLGGGNFSLRCGGGGGGGG